MRSAGASNQLLQAKLDVGAVDDPLESEADRVADAVIGGSPLPPIGAALSRPQRKCPACAATEDQTIRRKCDACEAEEEGATVRRKIAPSGGGTDRSAPAAVGDVIQSPGRPLDAAARAYFEPRFGRDFGGVRLHDDSSAADSARQIGAKAYTAGAHIVFAHGQYQPHTAAGDRLLAHELAHAVQQSGGGARVQRKPDQITGITVNLATGTVSLTLETGRPIEGDIIKTNLNTGEYAASYDRSQELLIINPWPTDETVIELDMSPRFQEQFQLLLDQLKFDVPLKVINEPAPEGAGSGGSGGEGGSGGTGGTGGGAGGSGAPAGMVALPPEEMQRRCEANDLPGIKVFPFRGTRFGAAPIIAHREGDDIVVRQPLYVRSNKDFRNQTRTLPMATFIDGVHLRPGEVVRVHVYEPKWHKLNVTGSTEGDEEREFCVTAEQMLDIAKASRTATWVNIGMTVIEGATLFVPVGRVVGQPLMQAGRTGLTAGVLGTAEAAPVAVGVAQSAAVTVIERQVERQVVGQTLRQTVEQTILREGAEVALEAAPRAAASRAPGVATGAFGEAAARGSAVLAEETAATALRPGVEAPAPSTTPAAEAPAAPSLAPIAGAEEIRVSEAEYRAALEMVFPSEFANEMAVLADGVGRAAAQRALADPRFVAAVSARNWKQAGTLFHSAAAHEVRDLPASALPSGWTVEAEFTVQAGKGGSRLDWLARGPAGEIIEFDWKTTGRSALSTGSRREMERHAGHIRTNLAGNLTTQQSKSWVDYMRALMPGVTWPR